MTTQDLVLFAGTTGADLVVALAAELGKGTGTWAVDLFLIQPTESSSSPPEGRGVKSSAGE